MPSSDRVSFIVFLLVILIATFSYGMYAGAKNKFPYRQLRSSENLRSAIELLRETREERPWYWTEADSDEVVGIRDPGRMAPGLTMVSTLSAEKDFRIKVVDDRGEEVTSFVFDIFSAWPEPDHLEEDSRPKSRPGTHVHGFHPMDDGGLVLVFEWIGVVRMNACGEVVWRLPHRAHHSIYRDDAGVFWVPGIITHTEETDYPPNYYPRYQEMTLLRVSETGELLEEISVFDLLIDNGLPGLLYLSSLDLFGTRVSGDTLHLNDIEVFPSDLSPGFFRPGDVMISLRNINGIFVFDQSDWSLKAYTIGQVLRQHDPDFIDGYRVAIFDNNTLDDPSVENSSRIAVWNAATGKVDTDWKGTREHPFYTNIMGKQQRLGNGNVLLVESARGRVIEVAPDGDVVWAYNNLIGEGLAGIVDDAQRLPPRYDREFYAASKAQCP